jgi:hypothetical protein
MFRTNPLAVLAASVVFLGLVAGTARAEEPMPTNTQGTVIADAASYEVHVSGMT